MTPTKAKKGGFSSEKTNKTENSWTGEKINPKDIVPVNDLLGAMEQNISLNNTVVFNTRANATNTHTIFFKNYDYTPPKTTPPPPPSKEPQDLSYTYPTMLK